MLPEAMKNGLPGVVQLQNNMRNDIQTILNGGFAGNLNDYYKALGY
jgi:hypothetical protein